MANLDRSLITDLPMFAGVGGDRLDEILNEAQSLRYAKGTNVFEQDAPATSFFILLDGHLRVAKLTPAGQQVVVRFVAPGEIFGVAKAIGRTTYPATATAVVDSVALVWPSAAWPRLIEKNPALATNALQTIGSRRAGGPHPGCRDVDRAGRAARCARAAEACQAGRPQGRGRGAHRLSDLAPGCGRDDRDNSAHREPHPQRLGGAGLGRRRSPEDRNSRGAQALCAGRGRRLGRQPTIKTRGRRHSPLPLPLEYPP